MGKIPVERMYLIVTDEFFTEIRGIVSVLC